MKRSLKKGFTLIETLVYLALFSIIFTVIIQFSLSTTENNRVAIQRKELGDIILLVNSSLEESFENSVSINSSDSVFNTNNGRISLNSTAGGSIAYFINNGQIKVSRSGIQNDLSTADFFCSRFFIEEVISENLEIKAAIIQIECNSVKFEQVNTIFKSNYVIL